MAEANANANDFFLARFRKCVYGLLGVPYPFLWAFIICQSLAFGLTVQCPSVWRPHELEPSSRDKCLRLSSLQPKETPALMWILCEKITWLGDALRRDELCGTSETEGEGEHLTSYFFTVEIPSNNQYCTELRAGVCVLGLIILFDNCTCGKNHCFALSACSIHVSYSSMQWSFWGLLPRCTTCCTNTLKECRSLVCGSW